MVTTAGATLATALITALDSSIVTSETVEPWLVVSTGAAAGSSMRFETPTAVSPPETMPATTAMAMIGAAPSPLRRRAGRPGGGVAHVGWGGAWYGSRAGAAPYRWTSMGWVGSLSVMRLRGYLFAATPGGQRSRYGSRVARRTAAA